MRAPQSRQDLRRPGIVGTRIESERHHPARGGEPVEDLSGEHAMHDVRVDSPAPEGRAATADAEGCVRVVSMLDDAAAAVCEPGVAWAPPHPASTTAAIAAPSNLRRPTNLIIRQDGPGRNENPQEHG